MTDRLKGQVALVVGASSIGPRWGNGKAAAVYLASDESRYVTAIELVVDSGITLKYA